MKCYSYTGINSALVALSSEVLKEGVWRDTPGFQAENSNRCLEFPYPVTIELKNPTARGVVIPERKWNKVLPFAESLWLGMGLNDLDVLPGKYVKNLYNFSDDGKFWRGGYGPRIREYNGLKKQYKISSKSYVKSQKVVDQLSYIIDLLKKDRNTRQALITIHDPIKDSSLSLKTKDQPCTRSIHFMIVQGALNCYVTMRSNDLLFGFSAVNVFNFTLMQEYVARMLGVPVGRYYHIAHNLHVYEKFIPKIKKFNNMQQAIDFDLSQIYETSPFEHTKTIEELDFAFEFVKYHEEKSYEKNIEFLLQLVENSSKYSDHIDDFFRYWAFAFYYRNMKKESMKYLNTLGKELSGFLV